MVRLMLVNKHVRDIQQQTRSYTCSKLFTKQLMVTMQELEFFFADFSKGFDLIDHNILMDELNQLEVYPALLSWIAGRSHIATDYFYFVTSNRTVT